jgi:hypothetical protein
MQPVNYERISPKTPQGVDVLATSTLVIDVNLNRRYVVFTNDSDTVMYLAFAYTAELHKGIRLNANGGSYEIDFKNLYAGEVSAIHGGTGSKRICIQEG